jgi:hypothetical protein
MRDMDRESEIRQIVLQLRGLELTGEETQQLLENLGMESQMLRQLMMTQPMYDVQYILEERVDWIYKKHQQS